MQNAQHVCPECEIFASIASSVQVKKNVNSSWTFTWCILPRANQRKAYWHPVASEDWREHYCSRLQAQIMRLWLRIQKPRVGYVFQNLSAQIGNSWVRFINPLVRFVKPREQFNNSLVRFINCHGLFVCFFSYRWRARHRKNQL